LVCNLWKKNIEFNFGWKFVVKGFLALNRVNGFAPHKVALEKKQNTKRNHNKRFSSSLSSYFPNATNSSLFHLVENFQPFPQLWNFNFRVNIHQLVSLTLLPSWMEREGNDSDVGDTSLTASLFDGEASVLSSTFLMDRVGEVTLTFHSDRLSWKLVGPLDNVSPFYCFQRVCENVWLVLCFLSDGVDDWSHPCLDYVESWLENSIGNPVYWIGGITSQVFFEKSCDNYVKLDEPCVPIGTLYRQPYHMLGTAVEYWFWSWIFLTVFDVVVVFDKNVLIEWGLRFDGRAWVRSEICGWGMDLLAVLMERKFEFKLPWSLWNH